MNFGNFKQIISNLSHEYFVLVLDVAIMLTKIYEANYPCILKRVFIVNGKQMTHCYIKFIIKTCILNYFSAPAIFTIAFNVLKKFLSPETIGSVKIMNSDRKKWEKAVLELVDDDLLPKHFGGKLVDENGDPKCAQMVKKL